MAHDIIYIIDPTAADQNLDSGFFTPAQLRELFEEDSDGSLVLEQHLDQMEECE